MSYRVNRIADNDSIMTYNGFINSNYVKGERLSDVQADGRPSQILELCDVLSHPSFNEQLQARMAWHTFRAMLSLSFLKYVSNYFEHLQFQNSRCAFNLRSHFKFSTF